MPHALSRALHLFGEPAPPPWPNLEFYLTPRTGNLMVVAGTSGTGKSMFAHNYVLGLAQRGHHCLYVSLDTTFDDQAVRMLSNLTRTETAEILAGREADPRAWAERWGRELDRLMPAGVRFTDRPSSIEDIEESVRAEAELFGSPPLLTVVDNVADLLEEEESAAEYHRIFAGLRQVAKRNRTLVMGLHHLRRKPPRYGEKEKDQGTQPVMKTDVLYGGDREPQYVLGLFRARADVLTVSILKNRGGRADPSSNLNVRLKADYERGTVAHDPMIDVIRPTYKKTPDPLLVERRWWEEAGGG